LQVTFWQGVMLQFLNIKAWMLALTIVAGWLAGRPDAHRALCAAGVAADADFWLLVSNLAYAIDRLAAA
jgi:threonine/homoserine/homoserine lactone efflux protein